MSSPASVHLLVLVHGLWGSVEHLAALAEVIKETHSKSGTSDVELDVLVAEGNQNFHTYDGIDWGAERVVEEVSGRQDASSRRLLTEICLAFKKIDARIAAIEKEGAKKVTRFSITGYSLGGLLSRYIIG